jgi:hypothetical protein
VDLTLVAYYGEKPSAFSELIEAVQKKIQESLPPDSFCAYEPRQVHATIIGLEGRRLGGHVLNTNYVERRHELHAIDFSRLFHILKHSRVLPFSVNISGYKDGEAYPFTSRDLHPYLRCFSIQGEIAVVIGWPYDGYHYPNSLDELRRSFQAANVLHKYHASPNDVDNDFFFTVGKVARERIDNIALQQLCVKIRHFLSSTHTEPVEISRDRLRVVAYVNPQLPPRTSCAYTLDEAEAKIDEIRSLYREVAA